MPPGSEPESPLVLTLDIGTSSVRAMIWDRQGNWVAGLEDQIKHHMTVTPDGGVETDPASLFRRTVRCINGVLKKSRLPAGGIAAVGLSCFWHSLMGVDAHGKPLTPLYTWADTRARPAVDVLRQRLDEHAVHARTGCVLHSSYWPAKLLWLATEQPEAVRSVQTWMSFGEYCYLKLFGQTAVSLSMASGTGLLDQDTCAWDDELLKALSIEPDRLSSLVDADHAFRDLGDPWRRRWPALRDAAWYPALGDGACSSAGSNCTSRRRAALMVGTSGALRVLWKGGDVKLPEGLWRYRLDRQHTVAGGAISNGGNFVDWLRSTLRTGRQKDIAAAAKDLQPDGHGLTVLPYVAGERSPGYHSGARAAFVGVSLETRPEEIVRAGLESVSYCFATIDSLLADAIPEIEEIVLNGGAILHSPVWIQIMADALGRRLTLSTEQEATSRGAALMALQSLGAIRAIEDAPDRFGTVYEPDTSRHAIYQQAAARQQRLYDLLLEEPSKNSFILRGGEGKDAP